MAIVIESQAVTVPSGSQSDSITATAPSGISSGDVLLLIIVIEENNNDTGVSWPTGWTHIVEVGTSSSDSHIVAAYKVSDGTEGAVVVNFDEAGDMVGWYVRLTGVDTSDVVDAVGAQTASNFRTTIDASSLTTNNDGSLAFAVVAFDGGDGDPFSIGTGTAAGWPATIPAAQNKQGASSSGGGVGGAWVTRNVATAGASGVVDFDSDGTRDGMASVQFALNEAAAAAGYSHAVSGVASASIDSVSGVSSATISSRSGV